MFLRRKRHPTLEAFDTAFRPDAARTATAPWDERQTQRLFGSGSALLTEFFASHASPEYNGGLLRLALPGGSPDLDAWNGPDGWKVDWPGARSLAAFAYDWLGRIYAVDGAGCVRPPRRDRPRGSRAWRR